MVRRPWGSSYSEDPDYEPLEDHDDELPPPPPPLRRWAMVKKRTSTAAATDKSGGPSEPASSTYHGEENVASDPFIDKEDVNVHNILKKGSETKTLASTNNIPGEETFFTAAYPSTFQHTYGKVKNMEAQNLKDTVSIPPSAQVPLTINGHLDMPLQDGADYKFSDQKDLRSFGPAAMSDVENGGGNIHPSGSSLEQILQAITDRHGDISKESYFKSSFVIATMLEGICRVIQDLEGKKLDQLDISALLEYDMFLEDAEKMNFNVKWLRRQVAELLEAVKSFVEATHEKSELVEEIENMKKDLQERKADVERLMSLVREQERELALRTLQGDMLSTKITVLKTIFTE